MRELVAELDRTLGALGADERRAALRALAPSVVRWYRQSLLSDPSRPPDVDMLLWVEELSAGLIGPLCAAAQDVRLAAAPRSARRMPVQRPPRAGTRPS
ncbi:hypothetical protein [Jiangella anatolica]|uniref:Uncharacterized protein n=1 Tax=Jiangella anatolica TaxID=2670374 RepID=A0A2W2C841_9ACTN|nr:hypothetical protein [Jiangella anatolica]PZF81916.1 hypothetical protein C1I92_19000 [Jiangella anatolica]